MVNFWSKDPTEPTLSKNKKLILKNVFCFLKKKEIKQNKHINNQNQEAFIVIMMNYTFSIYLLFLLCKIIYFKKY